MTTDVCKAIETRIRSGELKPGTRLPPISAISRQLGVPYSHVRGALSTLAEKKLIRVSGQGGGYLVSAPAVPGKAPGRPPSPDRPGNDVLDQVFLKVDEIARVMRVSKMTVYRLIRTGELESIRIGRSYRVPEPAVHDFLKKHGAELNDG